MKHTQQPVIKENSSFARIAAAFRKEPRIAMVLGNTIHLYGVTEGAFRANTRWVRHEMAHIRQFRQYGTAGFILRYVWEWIKHGYTNNRFEVEARAAEDEVV
ncbi:DUF4157 domain-containing protein [Parasegetibacter sp. NRK P23]|uniref:DUF4157 domain-containing protein n=1 Tax=Parasegetibacter sp. NRK P23 TaxID=2942999 RepID=UPI002043DBFB|nr:DUF4157 domain-containing protein [Parasegetibacter sp. NRK P23]MCM5529485.1 DUF4157 domain-containing protein [Parasegetibacter sp. NRK P23]